MAASASNLIPEFVVDQAVAQYRGCLAANPEHSNNEATVAATLFNGAIGNAWEKVSAVWLRRLTGNRSTVNENGKQPACAVEFVWGKHGEGPVFIRFSSKYREYPRSLLVHAPKARSGYD